jgi:cytochrome c nitrite reductase small subunit
MSSRSILVAILCLFAGSTIGAGAYVFYYSEGYAYLSNNPQACINCHAMQDAFDGWQKSSHHPIATCNSCHASGNFIQKYYGKALNGFMHSYAFTMGYKEPIQIKDFNRQVTERSCRGCHSDFIQSSHFNSSPETSCVRCHSQVGHLRK